MSNTKPRKVVIRSVLKTWIVEYVDRKKGQHYHAAQFDQSIKTEEQVREWIRRQPKLELL